MTKHRRDDAEVVPCLGSAERPSRRSEAASSLGLEYRLLQLREALWEYPGFPEMMARLEAKADAVDSRMDPQQTVSGSPYRHHVQAKGPARRGRDVSEAAAHGVSEAAGRLPHLERIQAAFGPHDVSGVQAHVGGRATEATRAIGAVAYATGNHVAFRSAPDLHTAAHEAAHVVQQRQGVQLSDGVGRSGDLYEQHADAVADAVVAGRSAVGLLSRGAGSSKVQSSTRRAVQLEADPDAEMTFTEEEGATIEAVQPYQLLAGSTPAVEINKYIRKLDSMLAIMGEHHAAGISNFIDTMQFEGSQSARPDLLGAVVQTAAKELLWETISGAAGLMPVPGTDLVVGLIKEAVGAVCDEIAKAGRAGKDADLAAYSRYLRSGTVALYSKARGRASAQAEVALPSLYEQLEGTEDESGRVFGDKGIMLTRLAELSDVASHVPLPQQFQARTTAQWITDSRAGGQGKTSDEGHELRNGCIRAWIDSHEDDGKWSFELQRIALYTVSHGAQAADLVRESITVGGASLWDCGVPVKVMFRAPNTMSGGRTWYECPIRDKGVPAGAVALGGKAREAWEALLQSGVTWTDMELMARTRLEGAAQ